MVPRQKKKAHCAVCGYEPDILNGHFAMIALAELRADSYWERLVVGLSSLFAGEPDNPL